MAPPTYADLGKASKDLFSKGYNFGFVKLDTTAKSGEVEFKTGTTHNVSSQNTAASIDIKYKLPKYGMTLTEKWNTDNALGTEVVVEEKLGKGVKLTLDSTYKPAEAKRSGKVKLDYSHDRVRATLDANVDAAPLLNAAIVAEHEGWLVGLAGGFDTKKSQLKSSAICLGRCAGDYQLTTFVNDGSEFGGNVYHRVSDKMEMGVNVGWTSGEAGSRYGLAVKYQLAPETVVQGKVSNNSQVGWGLTHDLGSGFKLTLSTLCSLQGFVEGNHKFGAGLEYKP